MKHTLILREMGRDGKGPRMCPTEPVVLYEVDGMPENRITQILNLRAYGREPSWEIRDVATETSRGDFKTAEEAFLALCQEVDGPVGN